MDHLEQVEYVHERFVPASAVDSSGKGTIWDLEGTQLLPRQLARLNYEAGFRDHDNLIRSVAVWLAESGGWTLAWHKNFKVPTDSTSELLSTDNFFPQLNDHSYPSSKNLLTLPDVPETWAKIALLAHDVFKGAGFKFTPWIAAQAGPGGPAPADRYMLMAINGVCNFEKERRSLPLTH